MKGDFACLPSRIAVGAVPSGSWQDKGTTILALLVCYSATVSLTCHVYKLLFELMSGGEDDRRGTRPRHREAV